MTTYKAFQSARTARWSPRPGNSSNRRPGRSGSGWTIAGSATPTPSARSRAASPVTRWSGTSLDLGAHHYLDSTADDIAAELQKLGGARVVVATAAAGSFTPLVGGLAHGGKLITVGATSEPIEISSPALIFGGVEVLGSLTGSSLQNEQNLRFAQAQGIRAVVEPAKFADLESAYARMLTGDARYRMVVAV